jgi:predicted nuclease of predicted toxin-antitoxin system
VKFLIDAQLPRKLATALASGGHEVVHTLWLPEKNRSPDSYIRRLADSEGRVVVTKDADFVTSHLLLGSPAKLLQITTGNLPNPELCKLILENLPKIEAAFTTASFIEITATNLVVHS